MMLLLLIFAWGLGLYTGWEWATYRAERRQWAAEERKEEIA